MVSTRSVVADVAWFDDEAEGERHDYACQAIDRLRTEQTYREDAARLAWELYTRKPTPGNGGESVYDKVKGPINGVRRAIHTLLSEMAAHKPRPMFLTSGANFDMQQRAKKAGKFCDGMYYAVRFDAKIAPQVRRDAMLFGDAFTMWEVGPKQLECERVFPLEVVVDEGDIGSDGEPMTIFRERFVDKRVLARRFPEHAKQIREAGDYDGAARWWQRSGDGIVRVVQAWRRGYDPGDGDGPQGGRWLTCIDGLTLDEGQWPYEWLPICAYHWGPPVRGYYGESVVEMVLENQRELDFLSDIIRRTCRRALPKIAVDEDSGVTNDQITNDEFGIVRYRGGSPPAGITLVGVSPQLLQERDYQLRALYDELGLSEMAVSSQMPAGLAQSGRAQLVYEDVKSKRQREPLDAHEEWYLENARTMLRMIKHAAKNDNAYEVVFRDRKTIERIRWADVDVDEDQYVMKAMPMSKLPNTPSGRLAVLDEWYAKQLIDRSSYLRMADMPDLEQEAEMQNAAREHAEFVVNEILVNGKDWEPHNFMQLDVQLLVGGLMLLDAEKRGANETNLGKLRLFLAECRNLMKAQQGANQPPPGGPQAGPPPGAETPLGPEMPPGAPTDLPPATPAPEAAAAA